MVRIIQSMIDDLPMLTHEEWGNQMNSPDQWCAKLFLIYTKVLSPSSAF